MEHFSNSSISRKSQLRLASLLIINDNWSPAREIRILPESAERLAILELQLFKGHAILWIFHIGGRGQLEKSDSSGMDGRCRLSIGSWMQGIGLAAIKRCLCQLNTNPLLKIPQCRLVTNTFLNALSIRVTMRNVILDLQCGQLSTFTRQRLMRSQVMRSVLLRCTDQLL